MRTSEDYGELFDVVRESIGTKEFYCHFSGVEHRTRNAMHYTQIKKSDLNFEPLAEFIVEDGGWLDITLISDSPLEHDAMYMMQNIEKSRHKQLERKAREDRRSPRPANRQERRRLRSKNRKSLRHENPPKPVEPVKEEETPALRKRKKPPLPSPEKRPKPRRASPKRPKRRWKRRTRTMSSTSTKKTTICFEWPLSKRLKSHFVADVARNRINQRSGEVND